MPFTICIIDDDLVSQFATRYCVQQYFTDLDIVACDSGEEGLSFCSGFFEDKKQLPDIIFLIILPKVFVLSAFVNANDRAVAKKHPLISGYFDKPLSRNHLQGIFIEQGKGNMI